MPCTAVLAQADRELRCAIIIYPSIPRREPLGGSGGGTGNSETGGFSAALIAGTAAWATEAGAGGGFGRRRPKVLCRCLQYASRSHSIPNSRTAWPRRAPALMCRQHLGHPTRAASCSGTEHPPLAAQRIHSCSGARMVPCRRPCTTLPAVYPYQVSSLLRACRQAQSGCDKRPRRCCSSWSLPILVTYRCNNASGVRCQARRTCDGQTRSHLVTTFHAQATKYLSVSTANFA